MSHTAIIGLGANIDAQANIRKAIAILQNRFCVSEVSQVMQTTPVGIAHQPDFFNAAVRLQTSLSQEQLVGYLKAIEDEMGRDRTRAKFGPREIDLDLVVWDKGVVDEDYYQRDYLKKLVDEVWDRANGR